MTELRLTGKTADGAYLSLADGEGGEYTLRISDTLRATVNQPRLAAVRESERNASALLALGAMRYLHSPKLAAINVDVPALLQSH